MAGSQKQTIEERARTVAEPILQAEGMELVDAEYLRERDGWILRLFIDKPGGVGIEDCTKASHAVETALDVEDFIPAAYTLEVSSPGLERGLYGRDDFERFAGRLAR